MKNQQIDNHHIKELEAKIKTTKRESTERDAQIKELKHELEERRKNNDNTATDAELKRITEKLEETLTENEQMKTTINNLIENTQQQKFIEEKSEEIMEMTQLLQQPETTKTNTKATTTKQRSGILLADSNRKYIELPQNIDWKKTQDIYIIDHLYEQLNQNKELQNEIHEANEIIKMLETNHIRIGESAIDTLNKMKETTMKIQGNIIETQTEFDKNPKSTTIDVDGYHTTEAGTALINRKIEEAYKQQNENTRPKTPQSTERRTPRPDNINTTTIDIQSDKIGIIMGKERRSQRKLERQHDVGIHINQERNTNNTQTVTIRGHKHSTEETMKDILELINTPTDENRNRKYATPCRYHQQGNCKKGDTCKFYHENTHRRQQRKRTHSPEQQHAPPHRQHRSRSRPRHNTEQPNTADDKTPIPKTTTV